MYLRPNFSDSRDSGWDGSQPFVPGSHSTPRPSGSLAGCGDGRNRSTANHSQKDSPIATHHKWLAGAAEFSEMDKIPDSLWKAMAARRKKK